MLSLVQAPYYDELQDEINQTSEVYQQRFAEHLKNVCAHVSDAGLIYDAVMLTRQHLCDQSLWRADKAEYHPAIQALCRFWQYYGAEFSRYQAAVPYIQVFLGDDTYVPLIPDAAIMPLVMDKALAQTVKTASVAFGQHIMVTFLASRQVTERYRDHHAVVHQTVLGQPFLKERWHVDEHGLSLHNQTNQLAWQTLKALSTLPRRFPRVWRDLKQQEGNHDDCIIH